VFSGSDELTGARPREGIDMKAVLSKEVGGPETLVLEDIDLPRPGPGEVLIDVAACAINFPDTLIIRDLYQFKPPRPFSPGGEISGTIAALGEGVTGWSVGDRVIAGTGSGGLREQITLQALPSTG
jgi:NADPH:quinone reductase